jgi:ElaB/YqjD/DUF883 family membrane-anchored ribosome-binding protein
MSNQESLGVSQNTHASSAAESARLSYLHARDAAQQIAGQVRTRASQYLESGKAKAADMRVKVEDTVREHPLKTILIAAGAGLLIGMLLRRR